MNAPNNLFPVLLYEWNTSINYSLRFLDFSSRNHFLKGGFIFQWGWIGFQLSEDLIFKLGGSYLDNNGYVKKFKKVKTGIETDNDNEELAPAINRRWKEIGHLDFFYQERSQ